MPNIASEVSENNGVMFVCPECSRKFGHALATTAQDVFTTNYEIVSSEPEDHAQIWKHSFPDEVVCVCVSVFLEHKAQKLKDTYCLFASLAK